MSFLLHFSKVHGLVACGGEDGALECFDMRARSSVGRINAVAPAGDGDQVVFCFSSWINIIFPVIANDMHKLQEVTAIEFEGDGGYLMAVGSSDGKV